MAKDRRGFEPPNPFPETVGDLNYQLTRIVDMWLGESPHYEDFNAAIGVLECAKLELYRRVVAPYEERKMTENGDVYRERS